MEIRQLRFAFFLCSMFAPACALGADSCVEALIKSITSPADVGSCALLSMIDGKVVAITTTDAIFVKSHLGYISTFYRINRKAGSVEIKILEETPWKGEIRSRQTMPDAKSFYYPFFLSLKNEVTGKLDGESSVACISPESFSVTLTAACPD